MLVLQMQVHWWAWTCRSAWVLPSACTRLRLSLLMGCSWRRSVTAADVAAVPSPYIQLPAECDPLVLVCSDEQGTMRPLLCKVGPCRSPPAPAGPTCVCSCYQFTLAVLDEGCRRSVSAGCLLLQCLATSIKQTASGRCRPSCSTCSARQSHVARTASACCTWVTAEAGQAPISLRC